jgi:hypothetical protein
VLLKPVTVGGVVREGAAELGEPLGGFLERGEDGVPVLNGEGEVAAPRSRALAILAAISWPCGWLSAMRVATSALASPGGPGRRRAAAWRRGYVRRVAAMSAERRPSARELLEQGGYLTTSDLAELGLPRRAVDALLRAVPTVHLPGYSRSLVDGRDVAAHLAAHTYRDGEQVRSC